MFATFDFIFRFVLYKIASYEWAGVGSGKGTSKKYIFSICWRKGTWHRF
jgi:hypothetical protein